MEDIRRKYILMVDLSKFTSNKKILSKDIALATINFVTKLYPSFISKITLNQMGFEVQICELQIPAKNRTQNFAISFVPSPHKRI